MAREGVRREERPGRASCKDGGKALGALESESAPSAIKRDLPLENISSVGRDDGALLGLAPKEMSFLTLESSRSCKGFSAISSSLSGLKSGSMTSEGLSGKDSKVNSSSCSFSFSSSTAIAASSFFNSGSFSFGGTSSSSFHVSFAEGASTNEGGKGFSADKSCSRSPREGSDGPEAKAPPSQRIHLWTPHECSLQEQDVQCRRSHRQWVDLCLDHLLVMHLSF